LEEKVIIGESDRDSTFQAIHTALKTLLEAHPTSVSVLRNVVSEKFPHKVFPTPVQASYIKQLLSMTSYVPSLRKDALELIIDRIVQVDVCSSITKAT
jgi:RNA polymerase I-specific transcription initiation factor RRN3